MNKLLKISAFSVLLLFSSGCATTVDAQAPVVSEFPIAAPRQPSANADLLYQILTAEMAGKRSQLDVALQNYRLAAQASKDPRVAERATVLALLMKENAVALEMAERWKALDAKNPQFQQTFALALLRNGKLEQATPYLEAVRRAALNKDQQQGYAALAGLIGQADDKNLAFQAMQQFRDRNPRSPFAQYYYALMAAAAGERQHALTALQRALALKSNFAPAHLLRTRLLLEDGDQAAALAGLAESLKALPRDRNLRMSYARLLVDAKQLDKARREFAILLNQNPKDNDSLYALGLLAVETRQFDLAETYFLDLIKRKTRLTDAYFELGRIEERRDDYVKARAWYERIKDKGEERYLTAQMRMGTVLAKAGDTSAANEHFNSLRRDYPQNGIPLYLAEAEALREAQRYQEAFATLERALALHPDDKDLRYARALAAEKINRLDVLEQDLRLLLTADPKNAQVLNALGYTLADRTDRYQEALGYIEQALAEMPNDAAILDSMGWVQYRLGKKDQAIDYLRRAYKANSDAEIAAHLSEVLWVNGQREEAKKIWNEALAREPNSSHLRKVREQLGW